MCQVCIYIEKEISNTLFKKNDQTLKKISQINIKGVPNQRFLGIVKKSPFLDVFSITGFLPTLGSFVMAGYKYGV